MRQDPRSTEAGTPSIAVRSGSSGTDHAQHLALLPATAVDWSRPGACAFVERDAPHGRLCITRICVRNRKTIGIDIGGRDPKGVWTTP